MVKKPTGSQVVKQPTGRQVVKQPTGNQVVKQPTGSQVVRQPTGSQVVKQPTGIQKIKQVNGKSLRESVSEEKGDLQKCHVSKHNFTFSPIMTFSKPSFLIGIIKKLNVKN